MGIFFRIMFIQPTRPRAVLTGQPSPHGATSLTITVLYDEFYRLLEHKMKVTCSIRRIHFTQQSNHASKFGLQTTCNKVGTDIKAVLNRVLCFCKFGI